jgi:hypothetical protein
MSCNYLVKQWIWPGLKICPGGHLIFNVEFRPYRRKLKFETRRKTGSNSTYQDTKTYTMPPPPLIPPSTRLVIIISSLISFCYATTCYDWGDQNTSLGKDGGLKSLLQKLTLAEEYANSTSEGYIFII